MSLVIEGIILVKCLDPAVQHPVMHSLVDVMPRTSLCHHRLTVQYWPEHFPLLDSVPYADPHGVHLSSIPRHTYLL